MEPRDVLEFWFDDETKARWFKKSDAFDFLARDILGSAYNFAAHGALSHWEHRPSSARALVILLDQVPRNLFRGSKDAFATDGEALRVARQAIANGFDQGLSDDEKLFLYLPFEHAEDITVQNEGMKLFETLTSSEYRDFANRHREVVLRFGRFPIGTQCWAECLPWKRSIF